MERLFIITSIGFLTGMLGTGIGGFSIFLFPRPSRRFFSTILGITGGLMLSIVCFDLLPQAFLLGSLKIGIFGIISGVIAITLIDEISTSRDKSHKNKKENFIKTGMLIGIGIAAHNFPEGLAIGSGFIATTRLGIGLAFIIAIHNIPEGIAMATPMAIGGMGKFRIILYTILAGIPMGLGAFIGAFLGGVSQIFIGWCLAFAGGAMLFIICQEIIPKSQEMWRGRISGFGIILGLIGGIILSSLI